VLRRAAGTNHEQMFQPDAVAWFFSLTDDLLGDARHGHHGSQPNLA